MESQYLIEKVLYHQACAEYQKHKISFSLLTFLKACLNPHRQESMGTYILDLLYEPWISNGMKSVSI
jgi:hypothetical protein